LRPIALIRKPKPSQRRLHKLARPLLVPAEMDCINLNAAKDLGIAMPPALVAHDDVIE